MRVLIVDDSKFMREFLRLHLQAMQIQCDEVSTGGEALQLLERGAVYQLMLLDWNMPGISGVECLEECRRRHLAPAMKVMMVTSEADHVRVQRALDVGADEFLMKPFSRESLCEKLTMLGFDAAA
ncbi:MAG: response regulator [Acidobacteriota bacterium]|nr:response regulator [Acidobacteriota bacterium]